MKTDEQIKKDIVNQLAWDSRVDANDVTVKVEDGEVTLTGSVPFYTASNAAWSIASGVYGVKKVENLLTVDFYSTFVVPTDEQIQSNIEQMLEWNSDVDESKVEVSVTNGMVTLEGTVASFWQKTSAEIDAENSSGVISVTNKLAVVPTEKVADEVLAERLISRIENSSVVDIDKIDVEVRNGKVTLTGDVLTWSMWRNVYDAVQYTDGVIEIEDQLVIDYPSV